MKSAFVNCKLWGRGSGPELQTYVSDGRAWPEMAVWAGNGLFCHASQNGRELWSAGVLAGIKYRGSVLFWKPEVFGNGEAG